MVSYSPIINDILDFSKIESGKLEMESHPLDLIRCVEDAAGLLRTRAAEEGLELMIELGDEVPGWIVRQRGGVSPDRD